MIFEDQLARSTAIQQARHAGRGDRFRAAGRRPRRRARAGHHDRRRLSLLRDREAQVHRRRHARPRAIHPQHGDRRLDRRSRRDPDRCAQGRADPDAAAFLSRHLLGIRHIVLAVNKMDLVGYDQPPSTRSSRIIAPSPRASGSRAISRRSRSRALQGRQYHCALRQHALVSRPGADRASRDGRGRRQTRIRAARSACRCNGSTGPISISAALPA
jgi:hypothetical protein